MAKLVLGVNDLATVNPELAAQLVDPSLAKTVTVGSNKDAEWFCVGKGDERHPYFTWRAVVASRTKKRASGCPACSGRRAVAGWSDLATVNPELAAQLVDQSLALLLTVGSGDSLDWSCEGTAEAPHPRFVWSATVYHRAKGASSKTGTGCPVCAGRLLVGWNDLATVNPDLAAQLVDPSLAKTVTISSDKRLDWFCKGTAETAHPRLEWATKVYHRAKGGSSKTGSGCPVCAGRLLVGWNDLATVNPDLAAQLVDPSLAKTVTISSDKRLDWFCKGTAETAHPRLEWATKVYHRAKGGSSKTGSGCPVCAGRLLVGWNDLATVNPDLAAQLVDPSLAKTVTIGSPTYLDWFCEGTAETPHPRHDWRVTVNNRTSGRNCPVCAKYGYDPSKTGWLYLLLHERWGMQQIGITNEPDERIGRHQRSGWELVEIIKFKDGLLCAANERAGLKALRDRGARTGKPDDAKEAKFDGYTESWPTVSLELASLGQILEWVRRDEW